MSKRNNKNIFKNTFRRHSNGVLYGIIFLLAAIITAGAIVMSNLESSKLDDAQTTIVTTKVHTTKEEKTEEQTKKKEETTEETTTEEETTSAGRIRVTTETINIRSEASEDGELIAQAEVNDEFEVIKKQGDWYKINFNGQDAYVSAELVEEVE